VTLYMLLTVKFCSGKGLGCSAAWRQFHERFHSFLLGHSLDIPATLRFFYLCRAIDFGLVSCDTCSAGHGLGGTCYTPLYEIGRVTVGWCRLSSRHQKITRFDMQHTPGGVSRDSAVGIATGYGLDD
jgi:hypothetical protein